MTATNITYIGFCWHLNHDRLFVWCVDYDGRVNYIKNHKPFNEQAVRLKLCQPVKGVLPEALLTAGRVYQEAWVAWTNVMHSTQSSKQIYDEWIVAGVELQDAEVLYRPVIEALHAKECLDCPWNGKSIFADDWWEKA